MKAKEQIEKVFKDAPWYAYKEGYADGVNEDNNIYWNRFRNEVASRNLQAFLGDKGVNVNVSDVTEKTEEGVVLVATLAVVYADALIYALKQKPEWTFNDEKWEI